MPTIYVSQALPGDDGNPGTDPASPKLTIASAVSAASANDEIQILDSNTYSPIRVFITKNLNFTAASGQTPVIDGAAAEAENSSLGRPTFDDASVACVLTFTGYAFQNYGATKDFNQIVDQNGFITVQFSQCTFTNLTRTHVFSNPPVGTSGAPTKLDRCRIERFSLKRLFGSPPGSDWYFLIQNSLFHYEGTDSGAVFIDAGNNNHVNGIVRNCSLLVGLNDTYGTADGVIRCGTVENTIVRNTATVGSFSTVAAIKAKSAYSNNCVNGNFAVTQVNTGGTDGGGLVTDDPLYTSESTPPDYELQSGSPCIDAGKTIAAVTVDYAGTSRPQGSAYDIGAYEFASGGGGGSFTPDDGEETYGVKFSSSFTIRGTANKLATRRFASDKDNRQAPFSVTVSGPATIRGRTTPYKSET